MNAALIQCAIVVLVITACCTGVVWGRRLRHRDLRRAQLRRIGEYRA